MRAAVGLMDGLSLDSDRCICVIPRHTEPLIVYSYGIIDWKLDKIHRDTGGIEEGFTSHHRWKEKEPKITIRRPQRR